LNRWVVPSLVSLAYNLRPSVGPARRLVWDRLGTSMGGCHVGHRHTQSPRDLIDPKPQIHVTALIEPLLTSYRPVG